MGSEIRRPSADLRPRITHNDGASATGAPANVGEILPDLFDVAVSAYHAAIEAERWTLVWTLGELIEAIDRISDQEEVG